MEQNMDLPLWAGINYDGFPPALERPSPNIGPRNELLTPPSTPNSHEGMSGTDSEGYEHEEEDDDVSEVVEVNTSLHAGRTVHSANYDDDYEAPIAREIWQLIRDIEHWGVAPGYSSTGPSDCSQNGMLSNGSHDDYLSDENVDEEYEAVMIKVRDILSTVAEWKAGNTSASGSPVQCSPANSCEASGRPIATTSQQIGEQVGEQIRDHITNVVEDVVEGKMAEALAPLRLNTRNLANQAVDFHEQNDTYSRQIDLHYRSIEQHNDLLGSQLKAIGAQINAMNQMVENGAHTTQATTQGLLSVTKLTQQLSNTVNNLPATINQIVASAVQQSVQAALQEINHTPQQATLATRYSPAELPCTPPPVSAFSDTSSVYSQLSSDTVDPVQLLHSSHTGRGGEGQPPSKSASASYTSSLYSQLTGDTVNPAKTSHSSHTERAGRVQSHTKRRRDVIKTLWTITRNGRKTT